ncbi:hypothetical protein CAT7_04964 [Carnobacterium sp. AT7]|uniref:hypothetical protein n=1 Tax=Carnobacterium sp. AT7 TaxID=333990 RepID=UPI00015F193D|nr:hypothetical protein [Carnobacterium sp. AT7]EDP68589.1 hypothetical protein CAT7_04964 [Carnobacterium sp. AT7]
MSYDDLIKSILSEIDNDGFIPETSFPELKRDKLVNALRDCEQLGYLSHSSRSAQPLIITYYDGFDLHPTTYVTRAGKQFIEGKENSSTPTHQYNIQSVSGANFGENGSVTINYGASLSDIQTFIESTVDIDDKSEANELVNTLEKEPITPGLLKRFDNLLVKYPGLAKASGQVLLSIATGQLIK